MEKRKPLIHKSNGMKKAQSFTKHMQNKKNNCSQKHEKKHVQNLFDVKCICQSFTKANMEERNIKRNML